MAEPVTGALDAAVLARQIADLQQAVADLKRGQRTVQLSRSSIDDGVLETRVGEVPMSSWGVQADGTTATVYMPGPVPPAPSTPEVFPLGAAVGVYWAGSFTSDAARPADFRYVEVHASEVGGYAPDATTKRTTILDTEGDGGDVVLPTTAPVYVVLVAVSTSGVRSAPSTQVTATPGMVVAQDILDGIVTDTKLAAAAVTAAKIAAGAVGTAKLAGNAVDLSKLADGSVSAAKLIAGAVGTDQLAGDAVTAAKLADGSVDAGALQANSVVAGKVAANTIGADQVIANAITATKIAASAVGTDQLAANSVVAGKVAANAIDAAQIVAGAIQAAKIAAGAVLADKIAAGAVTTDKLDALAVTAGKIAANAIVAGNIQAGAITAAKLAAQIVLASTIIAGTPGAGRVELSATGLTKFGDDGQPNITLGTTTSGDFLSITGPAPLTLTNYCPNPRLGVDASGWSATGAGIVTRVQAATIPGAEAVYRVSNGSGTVTVSTPPAPVDPTVVATVFRRVEVRPAVTRTVTPQLTFRNSAGTVLATITGADVSCLNGVATVVSVSADTVPSDTARVEMTVSYAAYTGATDLSRALCSTVNPGQYLGGVSYFDGASDGGMWSGTAGSSVSTVLTQTTDQVPLTSVDARGAVTAQALSVASREPVFGGVTLSDRVAASPGRVITYGQPLGSGQSTPGVSGTAPAESGFFTLAFTAQAGRLYRVCTSTVIADGSGTSNPTNVGFRVRYTLDGSTPTTASPLLTGTAITYSRGGHLNFLCTFDSAQVRLLLCTVKFDGATVFLRAPGGDLGMVAWVDDAGPNQGALSSASSTFSSAWGATWTRAFDATGVRSDTDLVQGQSLDSGSGLNRSMIGFNYSDIQTKLSGATITKVELYLYAYYWVSTSGGYVVVGTHNQAAAPAAYSQVSRSDLVQGMGRPAGAYLSLPTSVGAGLRDNTIKGVVLDATQRSNATDTMYTGKFRAVGQASAPILRITYTKPT